MNALQGKNTLRTMEFHVCNNACEKPVNILSFFMSVIIFSPFLKSQNFNRSNNPKSSLKMTWRQFTFVNWSSQLKRWNRLSDNMRYIGIQSSVKIKIIRKMTRLLHAWMIEIQLFSMFQRKSQSKTKFKHQSSNNDGYMKMPPLFKNIFLIH